MRKYILIGAVLLFGGGLTSYVIAARQAKEERKVEPKRDVCVVSVESILDKDGNEKFTAMTWQTHEPGNQSHWKIVRKPIGAAGQTEFSQTSEGSFANDGKTNVKLHDRAVTADDEERQNEMLRTPAEYLHSPDYAGTDEIAGLKVYKLRSNLPDAGHWFEQAYSPRVGAIPLRVIDHKADGTEVRAVAIKVEFK